MAELTMATSQDRLDEDEENGWGKRIAIALVIILVLGGIGYGVKSLFSGGAPQKKAVTTVKLLPDTPPPPPPPPKEPPKEQPKDQPKEVKVEPQPKPVESPPAEQLKMEGAAGDGPSPFAAGTVKDEYKGGDVKTVTIGKPDSSRIDRYAAAMHTTLGAKVERKLEEDKSIPEGDYRVVVNIWIRADGSFERCVLVKGTGNKPVDATISKALEDLPPMEEPPPENMPRPAKIELTLLRKGA